MHQDAERAKADAWVWTLADVTTRAPRRKVTAGVHSARRPQESGHIIGCAGREAEQVTHDN